MSKTRIDGKRSIREKLEAVEQGFWMSAALSFVSIASTVVAFGIVLAWSGPVRVEILLSKPLAYFVSGIVLLALIVVAIASFLRRKNRGTLLLTSRLSGIYLAALRRSAFNPQLNARVSDD